MRATTMLGNNGAGAAAKKREAQDVNRHTPRAAANHLSPAEITKRDAASVDEDAAALARSLANKPLKPPHHHAYVKGKCKRCGRPEAQL